MIPNLTDPSVSVVSAPVAAAAGSGPEFEASMVDEPKELPEEDAADDDDEDASDMVEGEPVALEQFVQKREILPTGTAEDAVAQVTPDGATTPAVVGVAVPSVRGVGRMMAGAESDQGRLDAPQDAAGALSAIAGAAGLAPGAAEGALAGADGKQGQAETAQRTTSAEPAVATDLTKFVTQQIGHHKADAVGKEATGAEMIAAESDVKDKVEASAASQITGAPDQLSTQVTWQQARDIRLDLATQVMPQGRPGLAEARHVSRQLAKHVTADQDRIEVTLTPEELGRVRLVMTPGEVPTVSVYADNQQTLDLLRRNADVLMRELSDTGFGGASLSFGEGGDQNRSDDPQISTRERGIEPTVGETPITPRAISDRRLDIRI